MQIFSEKMFSSSCFYEEPNSIYPTVEEQFDLAQKIANSLSADTNRKSKGADMFTRRVQKSDKWIHQSMFTVTIPSKFSYNKNNLNVISFLRSKSRNILINY